jgi:hypothetical protein
MSDTRYSAKFPGVRANFGQPVRFDLTAGFLGITQWDAPDAKTVRDRVLLSRKQVDALLAFLGAERKRRKAPAASSTTPRAAAAAE